MKQIIDPNKRKYSLYFYFIPFVIIFTQFFTDTIRIIILSIYMAYGLKLLFPFSRYKKNRSWFIDIWVNGYSLKFVFELFWALFFLFILIKFFLPLEQLFSIKNFDALYLIYGIIFSLLSIDIKKQEKKPERTFWQ
jgi:hypothetical protein